MSVTFCPNCIYFISVIVLTKFETKNILFNNVIQKKILSKDLIHDFTTVLTLHYYLHIKSHSNEMMSNSMICIIPYHTYPIVNNPNMDYPYRFCYWRILSYMQGAKPVLGMFAGACEILHLPQPCHWCRRPGVVKIGGWRPKTFHTLFARLDTLLCAIDRPTRHFSSVITEQVLANAQHLPDAQGIFYSKMSWTL